MTEQTYSRDFKGLWIPKEIWLDRSLSFFEKNLFAEIHSLDGEHGCYANNEYFMSFFNVGERTLQRALKKLKEYKYIEVDSFDGRQRILRSNISEVYRKKTDENDNDKFDTSAPTHKNDNDKFDTPPPSDLSSSPYIYNNKEYTGKRSSLRSDTKEQKKIKFIDHVFMSSQEHEKLLKDFGEGKTNEMIKRLDAYIGSKGKKYKSHYKTIITWIMNDQKESTPKKNQDSIKKQPKGNTPEWMKEML